MSIFKPYKGKPVPRAKDEPKFSLKSQTDRSILFMILIVLGILAVLITGFILIYVYLF